MYKKTNNMNKKVLPVTETSENTKHTDINPKMILGDTECWTAWRGVVW